MPRWIPSFQQLRCLRAFFRPLFFGISKFGLRICGFAALGVGLVIVCRAFRVLLNSTLAVDHPDSHRRVSSSGIGMTEMSAVFRILLGICSEDRYQQSDIRQS